MKTLNLQRIYKGTDCTLGVLYDASNYPMMATLEEPWRDNQKDISCIPDGLYFCKPHEGLFKDVWEITNVPNRSGVLIHNGNTTDDIKGCLLVGQNHGILKGKKAVLSSKIALSELKQYIGRANGTLNPFKLNIVSIN